MKKLITVLLLIFYHIFFAQEPKESNWILKLNTTQLVDDFSFPTVMVSAERKINPYFSVSAEAGVQIYETTTTDSTILDSRGFKANIEGRFYFSKFLRKRIISKRNEFFLALQAFRRINQATRILYYSPINGYNGEESYSDYFGVKKRAVGFNLIIGNQISALKSRKLILEPYFGIGYMNRKIENNDLQFDETKHSIPYGIFRNRFLEKGSGDFLNLAIGFRIGYRL